MGLSGHICRTDDISPQERAQMLTLMQRYYENVDRDEFEADFAEKEWVLVARSDDDGKVYGFSTQMLYAQTVGDQKVRVLFSGDTIIDHRFWARNPLAKLWGRLALSLIDAHPGESLYWFLISKGYKTYRFLPVFFREFYPRFDRPTPDWAERLIVELASTRFGGGFCESMSILKASESACRLRRAVADVTTRRLNDPHIAFFDRVNPGHVRGEELCCLAELTRANLKRSAFRIMGVSHEEQRVSAEDMQPHCLEPASP